MAGKKISELTEVTSVSLAEDYIVIQRGADNKKIKVANIQGSTNVGENYIDLKAYDSDDEFRMIFNDDGKVQVFPIEAFNGYGYNERDNLQMPLKVASCVGTSEKVLTTANSAGIVINQIYGGGNIVPTGTIQAPSVSHSFVELYNCNTVDVNLKGLYLHYKGNGETEWHTLALRGVVPPKHSFLVRGKQHGDMLSDLVRCKIYDYDQEWIDEEGNPLAFSKDGMSMYLSINSKAPGASENPTRYLKTTDSSTGVSSITSIDGYYVDLLGVGDKASTKNPVAYEKLFWNCMDKDTAIKRVDFYNNTSNKYDTRPVDYKTCNIEKMRPRSLSDGVWDNTADKIMPNENHPNLINISFGEKSTTRLFTWQSMVTDNGSVKLKRIKDEEGQYVTESWIEVESEREIVNNHIKFMTIHRAKVENLEPGLYEYVCGQPGYWSDVEEFEVKKYDDNSEINMLLTTDQQGFTEVEYKAWDICAKAIRNNKEEYYNEYGLPKFDFHLNTGDISQNASNLFEWLYYSDYAKDLCRNIPHMITCGNNDLVEKKYGFAFEHYATFENIPMLNDYHKDVLSTVDCPMVSTYSFDLGFVHYICLNSNEEQMYNDYGIDKTEFLLKQAYFLDRDLWKVSQRSVKPKWVIVYAHLSPFTVTRAKRLQHWIPILEKYGVDLFICGHNHTYSRSIPLLTGYKGSTSESDYNTYVTTTANYKIVDEQTATGDEIDRTAHKDKGVYYMMFQASAAKLSGKEKAIDMSKLTMVNGSGDRVESGLEYTKHFHAGTNRPWWYEYTGTLPTQPSFATFSITKDKIDVKVNYVKGVETIDSESKIVNIVDKFNPETNTITNYDNLTINFSDRNPAYRTGVSAPYYPENKSEK